MSTHTLKKQENGYWRLTFKRDNDWAEFASEKKAVAYLQNINRVFQQTYSIEGYRI